MIVADDLVFNRWQAINNHHGEWLNNNCQIWIHIIDENMCRKTNLTSGSKRHDCDKTQTWCVVPSIGCVYQVSSSYLKLECGTWYHHPRRLQCVKFSKSQCNIIDAITISKIIVFEIICNVAYYSVAKFTFSIEQPSNKATKCGIRGSWKLKVKPNLGYCSNIAITISYISVFVSSW